MKERYNFYIDNSKEALKKVKGWNYTYQWAKPYIKNFINGVDIGCREGGFAREMEDDFQHIYCYDFRDKSSPFKRNVKNIKKFTYEVCGLGEKEHITYTSSGRVGRIKEWGQVAVPIKTLDSFALTNVGFIKYDIEGYELKAIKGSEQTIKKHNPVIVVEQNRGNLDSVELLKSWGYECIGVDKIFNQDYLMVRT